jgi:predicted 3-demethylubiquinone-9 3-methyltransferase (glyoxalase superfamily)
MVKQKITTFLWFEDNAEEAIDFYVSVFKNSKVVSKRYYGDTGPGKKGSLMTAIFQLEDQEYYALNGGPAFKFNEAISLFVTCKDQEEIDELWDKLSEGGTIQMCGWLKDKYGLSWQIVPSVLNKMMEDKDQKKVDRVMAAFMKMKKFDIRKLKEAYEG